MYIKIINSRGSSSQQDQQLTSAQKYPPRTSKLQPHHRSTWGSVKPLPDPVSSRHTSSLLKPARLKIAPAGSRHALLPATAPRSAHISAAGAALLPGSLRAAALSRRIPVNPQHTSMQVRGDRGHPRGLYTGVHRVHRRLPCSETAPIRQNTERHVSVIKGVALQGHDVHDLTHQKGCRGPGRQSTPCGRQNGVFCSGAQ